MRDVFRAARFKVGDRPGILNVGGRMFQSGVAWYSM